MREEAPGIPEDSRKIPVSARRLDMWTTALHDTAQLYGSAGALVGGAGMGDHPDAELMQGQRRHRSPLQTCPQPPLHEHDSRNAWKNGVRFPFIRGAAAFRPFWRLRRGNLGSGGEVLPHRLNFTGVQEG
jgi:hypothetical protein